MLLGAKSWQCEPTSIRIAVQEITILLSDAVILSACYAYVWSETVFGRSQTGWPHQQSRRAHSFVRVAFQYFRWGFSKYSASENAWSKRFGAYPSSDDQVTRSWVPACQILSRFMSRKHWWIGSPLRVVWQPGKRYNWTGWLWQAVSPPSSRIRLCSLELIHLSSIKRRIPETRPRLRWSK